MRSNFVLSLLTSVGPHHAALTDTGDRAGSAGISGIWILANFCYAGMRAQNHPSSGWRIVSFIFGFPGTLISMLAIDEGSERAYGVELPRVAGGRK
jgi:hypothetical protein